ncbi:MAG TPA: hypothetical protein VLJ37_05730 [bacterium]|nr:hypothetical protein [bacterium]
MSKNTNQKRPTGWGILRPIGIASVAAALGFTALPLGKKGVVSIPDADAQATRTFGVKPMVVEGTDTAMVSQMRGMLSQMREMMEEAKSRPVFTNATGPQFIMYMKPSADPAGMAVMNIERYDYTAMKDGSTRVDMKMMKFDESMMNMTVKDLYDKIMMGQ